MLVNVVTTNVFGDEPDGWVRAEWVTPRPGVRMIRYQTDYDLSIFLRNVAVAGALCAAWKCGRNDSTVFCGYWLPGCGKEMPR